MGNRVPRASFDADDQIMFVAMGNRFETEPQIAAAFDEITRFWRRTCGGQKVYWVIDYTNFSLDLALTDTYAAYTRQAVDSFSLAAVRYTTDLAARATLRAVAIKNHQPSNICATREDAIAVVRELRAKGLGSTADGPASRLGDR
jgi:hypothetical protein